jgi:hypothetical protein
VDFFKISEDSVLLNFGASFGIGEDLILVDFSGGSILRIFGLGLGLGEELMLGFPAPSGCVFTQTSGLTESESRKVPPWFSGAGPRWHHLPELQTCKGRIAGRASEEEIGKYIPFLPSSH